jgi:hypothetical protein
MDYITRERFEKVIKNKNVINLDELITIIEEEFGYTVNLEEKNKVNINEQQKKKMSKVIFNNPEVLKQLHESLLESDDDYIKNEEEFMKIIREDKPNDGQL